ncbi:hypothetical protein [Thiohalophilus sp.]|uniref:hypothetical protein n=1 Tax=Thiohalophilus sp. TaxID=3028392 RepID=UPI002ACD651E|nr:hypothetical protein [Thiohalophilus sp.]MDZ7804401.1 hypothetical protein [Thiohalophilus sp.]
MRQYARFSWGRAWSLRSMLSSAQEKVKARNFLRDNQKNLVFVVGSGRSGTQLISDLLDKSEVAKVFHEPNFSEDVATMDTLRRDKNLAEQYWREFRSLEVYRRWMADPFRPFYGEVNGTIRYQVPAIKNISGSQTLMLMVRDGRGVVRSVMGWPKFYGPSSKGAYAIKPLPGDEYSDDWEKMSRFEKICWSWRETNEFLMQYIPESHWLKLEGITSDYDYFTEHFARNVGVDMSYETWVSLVNKKSKNATSSYKFPAWKDWSEEQKKAFERICGETMFRLGYEI